jgi:hypothetical protein
MERGGTLAILYPEAATGGADGVASMTGSAMAIGVAGIAGRRAI